jgi:hypothetical protein
VEPGAYYELRVSPSGHLRCSCPGFTYRGRCAHARALGLKLGSPRPEDLFEPVRRRRA